MTTPTHCTDCGHTLGVGRFCTNCGQPVPGRHPEAAPAASAPVVPPPTGQLPPAARYPLYADAPTTPPGPAGPPPAPVTQVVPTPAPYVPAAGAAPAPGGSQDRGTPWLPWAIGVVVLALVAGVGAFLLVSAGGDDDGGRAGDDRTGSAQNQRTDDVTPSPPDGSEDPQPDSTGTGGPVEAPAPGDVTDLTSTATAEVPATAPESVDRQNNPVTFGAANMLDGRPRTSWRMPGDGTGATLVFDLGQEVVLTEVGLINGYAKVDGPDNWYRGNRRIRTVQWEFDDGTRITQDLADRRKMQVIPVGPVATTRVVLHLVEVTAPGKGSTGRDFTAISDVRFRGAPA
ncbi:discoidin domain-containing protein [Nocardioides humi]|uniref:NAD glycohydrolase translocation F5/8 type C domain-containing protein n=1 Tax=Nocardioides humi TaxID=449461 RepID=A0ABN2AP51_9ACTN|nr:discoidin domain-containing protein [Nocardioides humi]